MASPLLAFAKRLAVFAAALVALLLVFRLGVVYYIHTQDSTIHFWDAWDYVAVGTEAFIRCSVFACEIEMPSGIEPHLWADASLLPGPAVALAVDEHGRVYVAEGERFFGGAEDNRKREFWLEDDLASRSVQDRNAYYQKWIDAGAVEATQFTDHVDRLSVLEDTDADGVADSRKVLSEFGERLDGILAGVLVRDGTAWVTSVPSVYKLTDADRDGIPETREVLSTGYGVKTSLQGHDLHGLAWGPDGRIYFSMGDRGYRIELPDGRILEPPLGPGRGAVFRMQPDGSELEVFATGLRNPQELAFDDFGNLFTADNNGDGGDAARIVYVVEGGDTGWAMPYQSLVGEADEAPRGPWTAEKLWHVYHAEQPAWIVPPIGHLSNGPAGFTHYPGLGLPDRYDGHFFLADYRYQQGVSQVWSFAALPHGAGFRVSDEHSFMANVLATDVAFGYDGRMFVTTFDTLGGGQQILVAAHESAATDASVLEAARIAREGLRQRPGEELVSLLGHRDQRIRLRAQVELAARADPAPLAALVRNSDASLLARIHALWALGQLGGDAFRSAVGPNLVWAADADPELRAQLLRVAGEAKASWLADELIAALEDPSLRARSFAATSLGQLREAAAVAPLYAMLDRNSDIDPFLRHAGVYALHRIGDIEAALDRARDPSRAIRLAALLQLRRAARTEIARFLSDRDPLLVVEAARAIYDVPIPDALSQLAALADRDALPTSGDPQTSLALHRRVIGANRSLGSEAAAIRLAHYATREELPASMRRLALDTLAEYVQPGPRDLAMSWYRPLPARDPSVVFAALDRHGPALIASDLGNRALEIATQYGRVPLPSSELLAIIEDPDADPRRRTASLRALAGRGPDPGLDRALTRALESDDPGLRAAARQTLATLRPREALAALDAIPHSAPISERQAAWQTLATIGGDRARARVKTALERLEAGTLDTAVAVEVIESARSLGGPELTAQVARIEAERHREPMSVRRLALVGGDPRRGQLVFQSRGDCQRCHGSGGHGAGTGPDLTGVATRRDREHVLESIVDPQASIAEGFETLSVVLADGRVLSGKLVRANDFELVLELDGSEQVIPVNEIRERSAAASGMPPVGLTLSPRELRDLLAYVATL